MNLVFATQNQNKAKEIAELLPANFKVHTLKEIGCHEDIPETAKTLEGNASLKSKFVLENYQVDCFADDTGLEVEALSGEPGVKSARYAGEAKDSDDNMNLLLEKLENETNRKAQFRTVISLRLNGLEHQFEGIAKGEITLTKSGEEGFGYDPIFKPEGYDKTFSEMSLDEKNKISHRAKAIQQLVSFLNNL